MTMQTKLTGRQQLAMAVRAIRKGRTMGQFIRELPDMRRMSRGQLQDWAKTYDEARRRMMGHVG